MDQENKKIISSEVPSQSAEEGTGEWSSTEIDNPTAVDNPPASLESAPSTVTVAPQNENVPKWFYFIFGVLVIVFIVMTTLLAKTLLSKQSSSKNVSLPTSPTVTKAVVSNTPIPTPVLTETVDPIVAQFEQIRAQDDISDLESDINTTDLSVFDKSLSTLDVQLGFTSKK